MRSSLILFTTLLSGATLVSSTVTSQVSLSGNYTPTVITCPSNTTFVRPASSGLNSGEQAWLSLRLSNVASSLETYLNNVQIPGFDVDDYIGCIQNNQSAVPVVGLALSGGGTRAEISGMGLYQALDARYPPAWAAKTGGLLQATTYIAGLSGGCLSTSGLGVNGFPSIADFTASGNINFTYPTDFDELVGKAELGYSLNMADVFGVLSVSNGNALMANSSVDPFGVTWSGIQAQPSFANGSAPMPILLAVDLVPPGLEGSYAWDTVNGTILYVDPYNKTFYEYTPFEFGSWGSRIKAFADLEYFGTLMNNSQPVNNSECINGYDSAIFTTGSVITAIPYWLASVDSNGTLGQFAKRDGVEDCPQGNQSDFIPYPPNEATLEQLRTVAQLGPTVEDLPYFEEALEDSNLTNVMYAYVTNPFQGMTDSAVIDPGAASQDRLILGDAGESGQEAPIWPLIQPERKMDYLIVSDNCGSELSSGWMNGTNLQNSYLQAKTAGLKFPKIPDATTMLNKGYTSAPVFFGCNEPDVPLVLYAADFPYTAYTNVSVLSGTISVPQYELLTANGLPLISQVNNTLRANWTTCVACGSIKRSLERLGKPEPEACKKCYKDYCWQGDYDERSPSFLEPFTVLQPNLTWDEWNSTQFY